MEEEEEEEEEVVRRNYPEITTVHTTNCTLHTKQETLHTRPCTLYTADQPLKVREAKRASHLSYAFKTTETVNWLYLYIGHRLQVAGGKHF